MNRIDLDHAATTPLAAQVLDEMLPYLTTTQGNPSSVHHAGRAARAAVDAARDRLAALLGCALAAGLSLKAGNVRRTAAE